VRQVELLHNVRRKSLKWIAVAAIGLAATVALQGSANAEQAQKKKGEVRSVYLAKYRVNNEVRYSKGQPKNIVKISAADYLSGNSYVCTPSGFGQKSRCYRRDFF
jgi:dsDNA-specific endonuclease/ATPase MutS2